MPSVDPKVSRRTFLKAAGLAATGAAGSGLVGGVRSSAHAARVEAPAWDSKYSVCDMCFNKCGVIARVQDGVIKKLDPNPKFLKSRGMLCARGNAGMGQIYDPDRLKHPLIRAGARGSGKWKKIPWDEALDMAATKMQEIREKYTPCGMLFSAGSDLQSTFVSRFAEVYGSFNVTSHESLCLISGTRAFLDTYGEVPFADVLNSRYIVMAGANRYEALVTPDSIDLMTAQKNGCKLVVLDPRYTKTAALADEWHAIKPGTDMAFMLALCNVIINENLYDPLYISEKTYGFEEVARHVQQYTPEFAAKETGIDAGTIRAIARGLAENAPASMVYPGRRSSDYQNSVQIRRSFALVNALLGNWDKPGGLLAARQVGLKGVPAMAPWYDENREDRIDAHKVPMMFEHEGSFLLTREAILNDDPYPIRGWMVYKTNPMATVPDRAKTIEMANKMDFMVVVDIQMSDTAYRADLVLPAPSYLERTDPCSGLQGSVACACVVKRDPVVQPMFESRQVFDIMKDLAGRMDLAEHFDFTMEEYRQQQLAELPDAMEALDRDGVYYNPSKVYGIYEGRIYKTLSKKIEMYNQRYEQMGLDPMPVYTPPQEVPKDRFRMVVGRNAYFTHGSTQNNPLLHEIQEVNKLWINPMAAEKLGISDGDMVTVASEKGQGDLPAYVTRKIREDTVYMLTGFDPVSKGLTLIYGKGASMSAVLNDHYDHIAGNAAMHETMVTVTRKATT